MGEICLPYDCGFAWLAYDYFKEDKFGKAVYTAMLLIIFIFAEIFWAIMIL